MRYALLLLVLAACSTPMTTMKNAKTGQISTCGGSTPYGVINYWVQKSSDEDCVKTYHDNGFRAL